MNIDMFTVMEIETSEDVPTQQNENNMFWKSKKMKYLDYHFNRGVVAKVLECDLEVSKFEPQSHYYVHFRTNTTRKGLNP